MCSSRTGEDELAHPNSHARRRPRQHTAPVQAGHTMADSIPTLTVVAGSVSLEVTGRAAMLIYQVAVNAGEVNGEAVGKVVASFAGGQTKLEIRRSLPAIKLKVS